ncbi:MAG: hypothetical protein GX443_06155 [Deltaproteobacteria bacterium]|nr:hypothetical protein [Deltaproteobacteria bacterium]
MTSAGSLVDGCRRRFQAGEGFQLSDVSFTAVLLVLRCLFWPYRGLVHDARLYAFQAFNRYLGGEFDQDLFFAFGSQDEYSAFSVLLAPAVAWLGVKAAFWGGYMLSSALLVFAEVRLVRRLIPDRFLADLGLVALAVVDLPYGGWGALLVHESFFTARLPAQALVLVGLHGALQQKWPRALAFTAAAMALHPLMAVGALAVVLVAWARASWRSGTLLHVASPTFTMAPALLVLLRWMGPQMLVGGMDEWWFKTVEATSWICFPSQWHYLDWYWMVGSLLLLMGARSVLEPAARRVVTPAVLVSILGVGSTTAGEALRSSVLLQGQGHRSLWLVEVLAVPLGILLAGRLLRGGKIGGRLAVLGILVFLGNPFILKPGISDFLPYFLLLHLFLSSLWTCCFIRENDAKGIEPIWHGLLWGTVSTAGVLSFFVLLSAVHHSFTRPIDPIELHYTAAVTASRLVWFGLAVLILILCSSVLHARRRVTTFAVLTWILLSSVPFFLQETPQWRRRFQPGYADLGFIAEALRGNSHEEFGGRKPTVYWPVDSILIWFDLQMNSYYDFPQLWGIVFFRDTAVEGHRRAKLVKPFEVARMRAMGLPDNSPSVRMRLGFLEARLQEGPPSRADLLRLTSDEQLDWIVLNEGFEGLYTAANGSVYVYDCRAIRRRHREQFLNANLAPEGKPYPSPGFSTIQHHPPPAPGEATGSSRSKDGCLFERESVR